MIPQTQEGQGNTVTQPDTFANDYAIFDSARRVMKTYPSPMEMDDMAVHAIDAALDNTNAACLLVARGDYTAPQWWEYAHMAASRTAKDTAMAVAVLAAPVTDGVAIDTAIGAARDTTKRVVRDPEHPGWSFFSAIAGAMARGAEVEIPRVRSAVAASIYDNHGDALVELGEISQDELIEHQVENASALSDLDGELAAAVEHEQVMDDIAQGKRADNSGDVVSLRINVTSDTVVDENNPGDLDALRYLYDDAREDMIELISTDAFTPEDAAGSDTAKRLADVCQFEPLLMGLVAEFGPSVRVLSHIYDEAGHDTMAHVNLAAQMAFVLSSVHADCFKEGDGGVELQATPEFESDFALVRSVVEDAAEVTAGDVSTHVLTTWTEHSMAATVITEQGYEAMQRGDEDTAQQAAMTMSMLSNPFNKSIFSAVFAFGTGQIDSAGVVSPDRVELWGHACSMALSVIHGDEDIIEGLRRMS